MNVRQRALQILAIASATLALYKAAKIIRSFILYNKKYFSLPQT